MLKTKSQRGPDAEICRGWIPKTGYGLVTDVCLKRKIRNYVETVKEGDEGYRIHKGQRAS